jgi:hypothetical protein
MKGVIIGAGGVKSPVAPDILIFLDLNRMLNSGKKNSRFARQKNKYSNSCAVGKKNSERNKKPYPPPCKLNGRSFTYKNVYINP